MCQTRNSKIALAVVVALAVGGGAYAFTASNTVPASTAGAGSGAVSGYTVTELHYVLNAATPTNIDSLTFTITPTVPSTGTGKVVISVAQAPAVPRRTPAAPTRRIGGHMRHHLAPATAAS